MFGANEKLWKQKAENYRVSVPEKPGTEAEKPFDAAAYSREYEKRKADEKAERDFVSPEKKFQDWQLAQVRFKTAEALLKEVAALPTLSECEAKVKSAQDAIEELRSKGYEPIPVVHPNPSRVYVAPPGVAKAPEPVEEKPKKRKCPVCGIEILETQGFHRLPEGEFLYCINDALKAKRSGLPAIVIEG